jgi:hypothetical protein
MENKVLTQEEIIQLSELEQNRSELIFKFGTLEFQIQEIELQKEILKNQMLELRQTELNLAQNLQSKYGEGTIDLAKGEFIPST